MALPSSGAISMHDIKAELGIGTGIKLDLGDPRVRALAGISSGAISLSDLYGKSNGTTMTTIGHVSAFNMHTFFGSPTAPSTYTLIVDHILYNSFYVGNFHKSSVIKIINNFQIRGKGGNGNSGTGGHAIVASGNILVIENNGEIWGGGGGGGLAYATVNGGNTFQVGGGGGSGRDVGAKGYDSTIGGSQILSRAGSVTSGGTGGSVTGFGAYIKGGDGGSPGAAGAAGYWNGVGEGGSTANGGAAGYAVINTSGTTRFTTGFNSTAVRGAVSPYPTIG